MTMGIRWGAVGSRVSGGSSPTPLSLTSGTLQLWTPHTTVFQNSNGTTAASAGDPVGYTKDQSGNNWNAVQATAGSRPLYALAGDTGFPALDIISADIVDAGNHTSFTQANPFSLFMIFRLDAFNGFYVPMFIKHSGINGWMLGVFNRSFFASSGGWRVGLLFQTTNSNYAIPIGNTPLATGATYVLTVVNPGTAAADVKIWLNGVLETTSVIDGGFNWATGTITNTSGLRIGDAGYAGAVDGQIGDLGLYSGDITSEVSTLHSYLLPKALPLLTYVTNLTATGNFPGVSLSWTAAAGATGYHIDRSLATTPAWTRLETNWGSTSYVDIPDDSSAAYYRVTPFNGSGDGTGAVVYFAASSFLETWTGTSGTWTPPYSAFLRAQCWGPGGSGSAGGGGGFCGAGGGGGQYAEGIVKVTASVGYSYAAPAPGGDAGFASAVAAARGLDASGTTGGAGGTGGTGEIKFDGGAGGAADGTSGGGGGGGSSGDEAGAGNAGSPGSDVTGGAGGAAVGSGGYGGAGGTVGGPDGADGGAPGGGSGGFDATPTTAASGKVMVTLVNTVRPSATGTAPLALWTRSVKASFYQDTPPVSPVVVVTDPVQTWVDSGSTGNVSESTTFPSYAEIGSGACPAINCTGAGEFLALASGASFDFDGADPFSVACIVKFTSIAGGSYTPFVSKHDGVAGWHLNTSHFAPSNRMAVTLQGSGYVETYGSTVLATGTIYVVVITYDGTGASGVRIWLNGVEESCTVVNGSFGGATTNSQPLQLGAAVSGVGSFFDGQLGDCSIYNGKLSAMEAVGVSRYLLRLAKL